MGLSYDIHRLHLSKVVIFCVFVFFVAYRDQGRRPYEVIVFLFLFFIDLISMCRVKNSTQIGLQRAYSMFCRRQGSYLNV